LFDQLLGRVAGRFGRVDQRRRARAFVRGLLADLPRKNCWTIAEHAGDPTQMGCSTYWPGRYGTTAAWVTGDEVYGNSPGLQAELEARGVGYVLAVACDHRVRFGGATHRADALLTKVPAKAWQCVSAGTGAKGHRLYDWSFVRLDHDHPAPDGQAGRHWLMIRRNRKTGELAFYRCFTPRPTRWPSWSASPAGAGGSRRPSRPARAFVVWTSTRSAAGAPGTGG
jgi:hypothetical protein